MLESAQRKLLLRVAYKTVSTRALLVIAGIPPIEFLAEERAEAHKLGVRLGPGTSQKRATIKKWPEIWDNHTTTAQWTTKLIPNIAKCLECTHRRVDYTLTQSLTGHGTYGIKWIGRKEDSSCRYCHLTLAKT